MRIVTDDLAVAVQRELGVEPADGAVYTNARTDP